jgi:hypothetical protein
MVADNSTRYRDPGGRPKIGPPAKWALPATLRAALWAARRTGRDGPDESEAAAARRLLAVALNPALPGALRMAAATYDHHAAAPCGNCKGTPPGAVQGLDPAPWEPCPDHSAMTARADALRGLADDLT